MRISRRFGPVLALAAIVVAGPALGFDVNSAREDGASPDDAFRAGTRLYYSGKKTEAASAFGFAAEKGHTISQWKLGRMYESGDGVGKDDVKAFEYYSKVVREHGDEGWGTSNARFVASAFVAIGSYYMRGIQDSAVTPNVDRAREIFAYAASYFGDADAQYNLGRLYLEGQEEPDYRMAAKWLYSAAKKGHYKAQSLLGNMLFSGDGLPRRPVEGLKWLSIARHGAINAGDDNVLEMQERAFALADEEQRRRAMRQSRRWIERHTD